MEFPFHIEFSYTLLVSILSAIVALVVEFTPGLQVFWERAVDKRFKPLVMALGVSAIAIIVFYLRCMNILAFVPAFVCDAVGLSDMLSFIAFGFGSNQLMFAFIRVLVPSEFVGYMTLQRGIGNVINSVIANLNHDHDEECDEEITEYETKAKQTSKKKPAAKTVRVIKKK